MPITHTPKKPLPLEALTSIGINEGSDRTGISTTTLRRECRLGVIKSYKNGRRRLMDGPSFRAYLAQKQFTAPTTTA